MFTQYNARAVEVHDVTASSTLTELLLLLGQVVKTPEVSYSVSHQTPLTGQGDPLVLVEWIT